MHYLLYVTSFLCVHLCRDRKQELFISNVNKAWDGVYTCLATNKYGSKTAEATVTVLGEKYRRSIKSVVFSLRD